MMSVLQNAFDEIVSIDSLLKAHQKAMVGKRFDSKATASNFKLMSNLLILQEELMNGVYHPRPYRKRIIHEPKTRSIQAPDFRDRITHHAIHNVLSQFYERHFIPDSYACRPKRGTHKAVKRVQYFLRSSSEPLYVCKLDISKFYASVNHTKLKELLTDKINDQRLMKLLGTIIDSSDSGTEHDHLFPSDSYFHTKGRRGIPIGNLTSQLFANIYMHEVDMHAKQQLKIRQYVRYMDDILFFHPDKKQLVIWQNKMVEFLYENLYLTINPRKIRIYPTKTGVDFVGFIIYPNSMRLRGSSVRRFKKRYRKQLNGLLTKKIGLYAIQVSFQAWTAHASHAKSEALIEHLRSWQDEYLFIREVQLAYAQSRKQPLGTQLSLFDDSFSTE